MPPQALRQAAGKHAWGPQVPALNLPRTLVRQPPSVLAGSKGLGWKVKPPLSAEIRNAGAQQHRTAKACTARKAQPHSSVEKGNYKWQVKDMTCCGEMHKQIKTAIIIFSLFLL